MDKKLKTFVALCLIWIGAFYSINALSAYETPPFNPDECPGETVALKRKLPPHIQQGGMPICYGMAITAALSYLGGADFSPLDVVSRSTGPGETCFVDGGYVPLKAAHLRENLKRDAELPVSELGKDADDFLRVPGFLSSPSAQFAALYNKLHKAGFDPCVINNNHEVVTLVDQFRPLLVDTAVVLSSLKKSTLDQALLELFAADRVAPMAKKVAPTFNIHEELPQSEAEYIDTVKKHLRNDTPVLASFQAPRSDGHVSTLTAYKCARCEADKPCVDVFQIQDSNLGASGWYLAKPFIEAGAPAARGDKFGTLSVLERCSKVHLSDVPDCTDFIHGSAGVETTARLGNGLAMTEFVESVSRMPSRRQLEIFNGIYVSGSTPLTSATRAKSSGAFEALLDARYYDTAKDKSRPLVDVNKAERGGDTPLLLAIAHDHLDRIQKLLAHDEIDPNRKNGLGVSPLFAALQLEKVQLVTHLLSREDIDLKGTVRKLDPTQPEGPGNRVSILHFGNEKFFENPNSLEFKTKRALLLKLICDERFDPKLNAKTEEEEINLRKIRKLHRLASEQPGKAKQHYKDLQTLFGVWIALQTKPPVPASLPKAEDMIQVRTVFDIDHSVWLKGKDLRIDTVPGGLKDLETRRAKLVALKDGANGGRFWVSKESNVGMGINKANFEIVYDSANKKSRSVVQQQSVYYVIESDFSQSGSEISNTRHVVKEVWKLEDNRGRKTWKLSTSKPGALNSSFKSELDERLRRFSWNEEERRGQEEQERIKREQARIKREQDLENIRVKQEQENERIRKEQDAFNGEI